MRAMALPAGIESITLPGAGDPVARMAIPQRYASVPSSLVTSSLLDALVTVARERWGHDDILIDSQLVEVRPGVYPGIPVWSAAPSTGSGVLVACLADEPLLEFSAADDVAVAPAAAVLHLPDGCRLRFRNPQKSQWVAVVLLRPRAGLTTLNRLRHCARVFTARPQVHTATWPAWASTDDFTFSSSFDELAAMPVFSDADIGKEPSFAGASYAFARQVGGPIVQAWLDRLPDDWRDDADLIIAAGRNELSPGWSPALLTWHMDGTSRCAKRADGTPDLRHPGRKARQLAACVGRASPTALLRGPVTVPEIPVGTPADLGQGVWQHRIGEQIAAGLVTATMAPRDRLFHYGWGGFHSCSVAQERGWRCFIKAMRGRGDTPSDRIVERGAIAWPSDGRSWPADALGIFPQDLPIS